MVYCQRQRSIETGRSPQIQYLISVCRKDSSWKSAMVYLDNAATTAAPYVMIEALSGACGNPSNHYSIGYEAKEFVDTGRAQVPKAINAAPAEIFFTGCGSQAQLGREGAFIITSALSACHHADGCAGAHGL